LLPFFDPGVTREPAMIHAADRTIRVSEENRGAGEYGTLDLDFRGNCLARCRAIDHDGTHRGLFPSEINCDGAVNLERQTAADGTLADIFDRFDSTAEFPMFGLCPASR